MCRAILRAFGYVCSYLLSIYILCAAVMDFKRSQAHCRN
uniref:Uncharacterized protein n=1 Tax=Anguilla anguilla TaxID=7936 RepID=A0A0E9TSD9_ANGAN